MRNQLSQLVPAVSVLISKLGAVLNHINPGGIKIR